VLLIRRVNMLRICLEVANLAPFIVAVLTFGLYTLLDPEGHPLTPQIAFVSMTLFSMLQMPLLGLGGLISQTLQLIVSNKRLCRFLVAPEVYPNAVEWHADTTEYECTISNRILFLLIPNVINIHLYISNFIQFIIISY
jgi:hypothetical protein